jgi:hypothetical protein
MGVALLGLMSSPLVGHRPPEALGRRQGTICVGRQDIPSFPSSLLSSCYDLNFKYPPKRLMLAV